MCSTFNLKTVWKCLLIINNKYTSSVHVLALWYAVFKMQQCCIPVSEIMNTKILKDLKISKHAKLNEHICEQKYLKVYSLEGFQGRVCGMCIQDWLADLHTGSWMDTCCWGARRRQCQHHNFFHETLQKILF